MPVAAYLAPRQEAGIAGVYAIYNSHLDVQFVGHSGDVFTRIRVRCSPHRFRSLLSATSRVYITRVTAPSCSTSVMRCNRSRCKVPTRHSQCRAVTEEGDAHAGTQREDRG